MEKFNITFWKEPYNADNSFVLDTNQFLTSAEVIKTVIGQIVTFHVKLDDIGLDSIFKEFDITRNKGFWETTDEDSDELNSLKKSIMRALDDLLK